jgi:replicative DNA helicase
MRHGIDMILIDYLQLMHGRARGDDNRVQEVSSISRALKGLARELRIPVIAISQLSRAPEQRPDKRPILSDLRESGCLAGDSLIYLPDEGTYVAIKELVGASGFRVLALNEASSCLEAKTVTNAFATGRKQVLKLVTTFGRSIRATANHKFLTMDGWQRLDELVVGTRIAVSNVHAREMALAISDRHASAHTRRTSEPEPSLSGQPTSAEISWDFIQYITPDGSDNVYDLTVEDHHSFVTGNVIAHNSIEQDSDVVMFLFRPEYYKSDERPGIAELHVAKHRNGPTGMIELKFRRDHTRFYNLETRRPEPGTE